VNLTRSKPVTKNIKTQIVAALLALGCAGPAAAADQGLPGRAINALGIAIASQGDAALVQIREELKDTLREHIKPYLPRPEARADAKSDPTDVAQR
jgi:parvulin-like peptidyl-prolyl isomerase